MKANAGWTLWQYGDSKTKLSEAAGENCDDADTTVKALRNAIANKPSDVQYAYLHVKYGDSGRAKYVLVTYVPDALAGMKNARANMHKPSVEKFVTYFHTMIQATSINDLDTDVLMKKIQAAAGANYGGGNAFSGIKDKALQNYSEKEKETTIGAVSYAIGTPTSVLGFQN